MPSPPRGSPGSEITLHINTVRTSCWLVTPFKVHDWTVGGMRVLYNAIIAPVGNAFWQVETQNTILVGNASETFHPELYYYPPFCLELSC